MNDFLAMHVFFAITTVSVIVFTVLVGTVAVYLIAIFSDLKYITKKAKQESDLIASDIADLRANVRDSGAKIAHVGKLLTALYRNKNKKK